MQIQSSTNQKPSIINLINIRNELPIWLAAFLLCTGALGGNFDLSRLVNIPGFPSVHIATSSTILAFPLLLTSRYSNINLDKRILVTAGIALFFYIAVAFRTPQLFGHGEYNPLAYKILMVCSYFILLAWACLKWKTNFVYKFSIACVVFSAIWACGWMFRCYRATCFQDAIPYGTAYSFYRVELLGFFSAIYIWSKSSGRVQIIMWLALSILLMFACLSSLSKAAWIACLIAVITYCFVQLVWFSSRAAAICAVLFSISVLLSYLNIGNALSQRIEQVSSGTGHSSMRMELLGDTSSRSAIMALNAINGNLEQLKSLPIESQYALKDFSQNHIILPDLSYRLRLIRAALQSGSEKPWFGNGFFTFRYDGVNIYSKELEVYYYPHNIFAEVYYSAGIFGILFFCSSIFLGYVVVLRGREMVINSMPFLSMSIGILSGSFFGGDIMDFSLFWSTLVIASAALDQRSNMI